MRNQGCSPGRQHLNWALKDAGWTHRSGKRLCVEWRGAKLRENVMDRENLAALLQTLVWFWGLRGMPGILPIIYLILKIPVR